MRRIIYICDKCGNSFENEGEIRALDNNKDICFECWQKLRELTDAFFEPKAAPEPDPEPVKEEPKEAKSKPRTKIDWDKACALKLAGWSNKQIADELNINKPTVDTMIYKMLERYNDGERFGKQEEAEEDWD